MKYFEVYPIDISQGLTDDGMCVLTLFEPSGNHNIPIVIDQHQADMLMMELSDESSKRPQTHELISSILDTFFLTLKDVHIDKFIEGIFYATLRINDGINTRSVDSRASDALLLALHYNVPIMVSSAVIDATGYESDFTDDMMHPSSRELSLDELTHLLNEAEAAEEYERAAEIMEEIKRRQQ